MYSKIIDFYYKTCCAVVYSDDCSFQSEEKKTCIDLERGEMIVDITITHTFRQQ